MLATDVRETWFAIHRRRTYIGRTCRQSQTVAATAARRVLADRTEFIMSPKVAKVWEAINKRQSRDLPGLRKLMKRASPFATG